MPKQDKKRVILEKVKDEKYIVRYDLRVHDPSNPEARNLLVGAHAYTLDDRILLVLRTPHKVRWRVFSQDTPFGNAKTIPEADKRLYGRLRQEAPDLVRTTNEFHAFYDETGMGRHYNFVRPKTS